MNTAAEMPTLSQSSSLMDSFRHEMVKTSGAEIRVAIAGNGPPLLLIHGNPLTHVSWHKVAPALAKTFTVIAPDLRGYGDSSKPAGGEDHAAYTFRAMGEDNFDVMDHFGFERFQIAGHDRGARVGFRMALDRPDRVERLAALDIVPTHHVLTNVTLGWGLESYHWFFMAQKAPFPERLICADLDYYIHYKLNKKGVGLEIFTPDAMAEYVRCTTPEQIHAVCEDYRATVTLDLAMDTADYGKRRILCPVMVIWGTNSHCGRHFKPVKAWSEWADDLRGFGIPTGHYPAEHRPDIVYPLFWDFFTGREPHWNEAP
ncbi:Alpha/beta hydrolase fold [Pseudorhizobium banfieldiae]|uniref:Alpha/beta hydrolase fold n=1 Tax=Pseudorhizobium banfieldiae TaxID=1125847 RepID=L0NBE2_9HYPH|nr:alpha/beta hydrolase [Pseudorhizobium banfieldiae]CAD6602364.1 alpha/beta hydrolase [arsenite-oxidising bacterium NT-25]CCF18433.1 Alpha/beta hydrolase fold [Pseudorhizobium banfieldiae]